MIKIKKVLCPLDFSTCSQNALKHALKIAPLIADELHLFHAIILYEDSSYKPDDRLSDNLISYDLIEDISNQKMQKATKDFDQRKIKIVTANSRGFSAADEILNYAAENDIDLIIMGTHGRTAIAHFLLGSVAERVVQLANCPVMTIRENVTKFFTHNKILVPVDLSEYSRLALIHALQIAEAFNLSVTLFHSFEQQIHPAFYVSGKTSIFEIDAELKKRALAGMEKFRNEFEFPGVKTEYALGEGAAYHEILEFVEKVPHDLIVMGSHGLKGLEHFLLGSTTEKVVRSANVPVLTVKKAKSE